MVPTTPSAKVSSISLSERLRAIAGFSHLPTRVANKLVSGLSIERAPAKTILVREGRPQESVLFLFEGILQQFTGAGRNETTLAILKAPSVVQPHAIYRGIRSPTSIRALRDSSVGRIAMPYARRLLREESKFADAIRDHVVTELENLLLEHKSARTRNGLGRLVAWIVAMQQQTGAAQCIMLPYDKAALAARLGVAPATLSRDFARLEAYGVTVHGRALTIEDPALLRTLTNVDSLNAPPVP